MENLHYSLDRVTWNSREVANGFNVSVKTGGVLLVALETFPHGRQAFLLCDDPHLSCVQSQGYQQQTTSYDTIIVWAAQVKSQYNTACFDPARSLLRLQRSAVAQ